MYSCKSHTSNNSKKHCSNNSNFQHDRAEDINKKGKRVANLEALEN